MSDLDGVMTKFIEIVKGELGIKDSRIAELENLADARLKDRLIMQESNVTAHKRITELESENQRLRDERDSLVETVRSLRKTVQVYSKALLEESK